MFSCVVFVFTFVLVAAMHTVDAVNLTILIGAGSSYLSVSPQNITITPPATLRFSFEEGNHSIVQGDLNTPCQSKPGGFNSGFMPVLGAVVGFHVPDFRSCADYEAE